MAATRSCRVGFGLANIVGRRLRPAVDVRPSTALADAAFIEKMLNFIRTTDTQTGLVVTAYLDRN